MELSDPTAARVHLINPLWDPTGGSDWRTIDTWRLLRRHAAVRIWTEFAPSPAFAGAPVERIRKVTLKFPRGGTFVFIGTYFRIGHWTRFTHSDRAIIIYNTDQPDRLAKNVARLERGGHAVEVVYTSRALRRRHGASGHVLESPIDVTRFRPWRLVRPKRPFTVGRMVIFSRVRLGVNPVVNALATLMVLIVALGVILSAVLMRRQEQRRKREEQMAAIG